MPSTRTWSREEVTLALALYYQLPFGSLHQRNPAVIALSAHLGRTPGAIALKLVNLASLDPTVTSTGRSGMRNASNADREIFLEYQSRWDALATILPVAVEEAASSTIPPDPDGRIAPRISPEETIRRSMVNVRRGQGFFRNAVRGFGDRASNFTAAYNRPATKSFRARTI